MVNLACCRDRDGQTDLVAKRPCTAAHFHKRTLAFPIRKERRFILKRKKALRGQLFRLTELRNTTSTCCLRLQLFSTYIFFHEHIQFHIAAQAQISMQSVRRQLSPSTDAANVFGNISISDNAQAHLGDVHIGQTLREVRYQRVLDKLDYPHRADRGENISIPQDGTLH